MENDIATRIVSVRAADGGARLLLTLETVSEKGKRREGLSLFSSRLQNMPQPGEITPEEEAFYRREEEISAAITAGLRALSAGGCSRRALILKLRRKGISAAAAHVAVDELSARGYLAECEGALREAERGMAKLWGDRRILADIRAKGYGEESLAAVEEKLAAADGVARCVALIRRRHVYPTGRAEAMKLAAALTRYGYDRRQINAALGAVEIPFIDD